jgi:spermidine/putrescine transport system ATP-binding protein
MAEVAFRDVSKSYDGVVALDGVNLTIASGEFITLLGPSGSGKTTLLNIISGMIAPTSDAVLIDGQDVTRMRPQQRGLGMVFQNYALMPHMTVFDNVAFPLRIRKLSRTEIEREVMAALELVRLAEFSKRKPRELSGGQQQRVALARALILNPAVLLLYEPLGALDAKLRKALQIELKALQQQVGITFIYVTHDQEEALTMSDRIAVMSDGRVEQVAAPHEVYEEPSTTFVADFLGVSNLMSVTAHGDSDGRCRVSLGDFELYAGRGDTHTSGETRIVIRPERVRLEPHESSGENRVPGMVERVIYLGNSNQVIVRLANGDKLQALVQNTGDELAYKQGDPVRVELPAEALRVLTDTGTAPIDEGAVAPATA